MKMKLHEAMRKVLLERGVPMSPEDLASEINFRQLYERRDGKPLPVIQLKSRANNYSMFTRTPDGKITLNERYLNR